MRAVLRRSNGPRHARLTVRDHFEASVEHFVAEARKADRYRRAAILKRWQAGRFGVRQLAGLPAGATAVSASAASSITIIKPPPS
jgi:hypothetical protein